MSERWVIGLVPGASNEDAGTDAAKYGTSSKVVIKLIMRWMDVLSSTIGRPPGPVIDVGVGEGFAVEGMFPDDAVVFGLDYRLDKAMVAKDRVARLSAVVGDAGMLPFADSCVEVCSSIEMLEHLTVVDLAVRELARVTSDRCVVSVPWEPWFRLGNLARGKNISRFGNDIEHVQAFSPKSLRALMQTEFAKVEILRSFPWLIANCSGPLK